MNLDLIFVTEQFVFLFFFFFFFFFFLFFLGGGWGESDWALVQVIQHLVADSVALFMIWSVFTIIDNTIPKIQFG